MKTTEFTADLENIPAILTVKDVQRLLRMSLNTAYTLIRSGELRAKTVGRQLRIPRDEFLRYLNT